MLLARPAWLFLVALATALVPATAAAHDGHAHTVTAGAAWTGKAPVPSKCVAKWVKNAPGQGRACPIAGGEWRIDVPAGADMVSHGPDAKVAKSVRSGAGNETSPASTSDSSVRCADAGAARFRVVYALPVGETDRFATREEQIRQMVLGASETVRLRAEEMSPGLESRINVICNASGEIDVQKVLLYTHTSRDSFATIAGDLRKRGVVGDGENVVGFVEGVVGGGAAGQAARPNDPAPAYTNRVNNGGQVALVYRNAGALWQVALHEMSHTLGAVADTAPDTSKAGHCIDGLDVMCYNDGGPRGRLYATTKCSSVTYDCGGDDYFNPAPTGGSWLASSFNLALPQNQFFRHRRATDTTAPTAAITSPATDGVRANQVVVDGADDVGVDKVELLVGGTVVAQTSVVPAKFPLGALAPGATTVTARIHDTNGNTSSTAVRSFEVDAAGPTVTVGAIPLSVGDSFWIRPTVTDPAGVTDVRVWTSDSTFVLDTAPPFELGVNVAKLPEGPHTFDLVARDAVGNVTTTPVTVDVDRGSGLVAGFYTDDTFGTLAGSVNAIGPLDKAWPAGPIKGLPADGWAVRFGGRMRIPDSTPLKLHVYADDKVRVKVDGSLVVDAWSASPARVLTSAAITSDPGEWHDVEVEYADVSGASAVQLAWQRPDGSLMPLPKAHLDPDANAPSASIAAPAAGATVYGTTTVAATGTDDIALAKVEFRLDGKLMATDASPPFTWDWGTTSAARGAHQVEITPVDVAGNRGTASARSVTVDNGRGLVGTYFDDDALTDLRVARLDTKLDFAWKLNAPATSMGADTFSARWEGRIRQPDGARTLHLTFDDGARMWIDGIQVTDAWTSGAATAQVPLTGAAGVLHDIKVEFVDRTGDATFKLAWQAAGGAVTAIPVTSLYPEATAPTVTLDSPTAGATSYGTGVALAATATDDTALAKVEFLVDGKLLGTDVAAPFAATWTPTAADNGTRTVTARAVDAAGNAASASATVTIDVGTGLRASYWSETDFATGTRLDRIDPMLSFSWGTNGPHKAIGVDTFSASWRGEVRVPDGAERTLYVAADDGLRVTVDGTVVVDQLAATGAGREVSVPLPAGAANRRYDVEVQYVEQTGASFVRMLWATTPGGAKQPVPTASLYPAAP